MNKTMIITSDNSVKFTKMINEFIVDKEIVDIKYKPVVVITDSEISDTTKRCVIVDRALIIYKEQDEDITYHSCHDCLYGLENMYDQKSHCSTCIKYNKNGKDNWRSNR